MRVLLLSRPRQRWRQSQQAPKTPPGSWLFTTLLLVLTFGTGVIDAASYVGLHQIFTANMTGNVVFLGLGIAGHSDVPVVRAVIALVAFVVGAVTAGRIQRRISRTVRCPRSSGWLLIGAALLVVSCAVAYVLLPLNALSLDVFTGLLGVAMGVQAGVAKRMAVTDVSTVVVTMTLASWALDSRAGGGGQTHGLRRIMAVAMMMLGAVVGALLLSQALVFALGLSSLIVLSVALVMLRVADRNTSEVRNYV